ncbi:unnamed protein product [Euphydryas editha]|uniref:Reverse transcriptase domain-containing protein n=1 Tax=Euphydryas editha TaxID=104508 RepID=A0AAU9UCK3_EUPED|nr:unnamed protein product [Euphydryas editha]
MTDNVNYVNNNIDQFSISITNTCSPEATNKIIQKPRNFLKILSHNIRSINCNFLSFQTLLHRINIDCDIVVLTECWLPCLSNTYIPILQNYTSFKTTKHINQSDGVVVYIKNDLLATCEEPDFNLSASGLIIRINSEVAILCIYRSPSIDNIDCFLTVLNKILPSLYMFKSVVITGDINVDIKPSTLDMRSHNYLNCLAYHGYLPAHTLPTRAGNCLDHTMLKTNLVNYTFLYDTTVTDHYPTLVCIHKKVTRTVTNSTITKIDSEGLDRSMLQMDFTNLFLIKDASISLDGFIKLLTTAITANTSTNKVPAKKKILKPWITPGLLRCIRNRDALHKKVKKAPDNEILRITYNRYRNFCARILKKVKRRYDIQELDNASHNPKALWDTIKRVTYTTKTKHKATQLLSLLPTPVESCNEVNSYFVNIGQNLANSINNSSRGNPQPSTYVEILYDNSPTSSFVLHPTNPDEIVTTINSLRSSAAIGWDGIPPSILKKYSVMLGPILSHIFNLCFETAVFPTALKKAIIHPVLKDGDANLPSNYRPIAVLSSLSKILERLINKRLVQYLEHFGLISEQQYGFRKGRSTNGAVLDLVGHVVQNLNQNKKVLSIFLDLKKAFDTIPITTLLLKLEKVGVRGLPLKLFQNYLTDRSQMVRIDSYGSDELPVYYGVPQGSILGPTLFLIFINDLCNLRIPNGRVVSFADDTALTFVADTWPEVETKAQLGLNLALNWLRCHTLTLNTTKTNFITYSISTASQPSLNLLLKAHVCSNVSKPSCECPKIESVDCVKYLGILVDKNLNFKAHIGLLTGRIRKLMFLFKTLRSVANQIIVRKVYFALCLSVVTYCITTWGGAAKTNLKPLEVAHKGVLKVATFRPITFPTVQLYDELNVLNVRQHFILQTVLLQHQNTPYRNDDKRRKDEICFLPRTRSVFSRRFFYYLGPSLYNKINKKCQIYGLSYYNCKKSVRSFLQNKTYDETEKYLT